MYFIWALILSLAKDSIYHQLYMKNLKRVNESFSEGLKNVLDIRSLTCLSNVGGDVVNWGDESGWNGFGETLNLMKETDFQRRK